MRLDVDTVQDVALLRQVIHLQEAEIGRLHKRLAELTRRLAQVQGTSESAALQGELVKLSEELSALQHRLYGPQSEKRSRPEAEPAQKPPQRGHGPHPAAGASTHRAAARALRSGEDVPALPAHARGVARTDRGQRGDLGDPAALRAHHA